MIRFAERYWRKRFPLRECETGPFDEIRGRGMRFESGAWEVEGAGHLSVLRMKAMLGLIRMESVIFAPFEKDLPLFSADLIRLPWKNTLLVELYDLQLDPLPDQSLREFETLKEEYSRLEDYRPEERWYDALRLPQSIMKTGEKTPETLERIFRQYLRAYVRLLRRAPACDPERKRARVKTYTDGLLEKGGTAVDTMKKILGEEGTAALVEQVLFGTGPRA